MSQFISQPAPDVVDNLTTNDSTKALSAAQGKALNDKITTLESGQLNITAAPNTTTKSNTINLKKSRPNTNYAIVASQCYTDTTTYNQIFISVVDKTTSSFAIRISSLRDTTAYVTVAWIAY